MQDVKTLVQFYLNTYAKVKLRHLSWIVLALKQPILSEKG